MLIYSALGELLSYNSSKIEEYMPLKPGPKPIAKSTGEVDKRRRDNKDTPKNNPALKPSKSSTPTKK
jgi:hypothetical protein